MTIDYMHLLFPSIYPPLDSEDTPPACEPEINTNIVNVPVSDDAFICAICLDSSYDEDSNYTQHSNTHINPNFDNKKHNLHIITSCNHHFHYGCLQKWCIRNNSCPSCRQQNILLPDPYANDSNNKNYRYNDFENNEQLNDFNNILQNSINIDSNHLDSNDDLDANHLHANHLHANDLETNDIDILSSQVTLANAQLELALAEARLLVTRARVIATADSVESGIITVNNIEATFNRLNNNITNTINDNINIINNIVNNNNIMLRM